MPPDDLILVQTTFAQRAHAEEISAALVDLGLAACVQVSGPVLSVYRWKDRLQREEEYVLTAKTLAAHYRKLAAFIGERHPYELPEIIAIPLHAVSDDYLDWARKQCA